jgi:cytochrome o ubiquinol oxidase operon protein cyoD
MSTLTSYITGFVLSIVLTLAAFGLIQMHEVTHHAFSTHAALMLMFSVLAVLQLLVQLYFFLHLSKKQKTHWNVVVLGFALFIITVVVGGTLWILSSVQHYASNGSPYIDNTITAQNSND